MGIPKCSRYILVIGTSSSEKSVRSARRHSQCRVPYYKVTTWSKGDLALLLDEHFDVRERYFPSEMTGVPPPHRRVDLMYSLERKDW